MFQYDLPDAIAEASAASAVAVVPPLAVMYDAFQLPDWARSNVFENVPLNTPKGKPTKLGEVVATPAVPVKGLVVAA